MTDYRSLFSAAIAALIFASIGDAVAQPPQSPQAASRTYAQNYKDMVLAICIANAYKGDKQAAIDAGSSVSALRDWAYYDLEKAPDEISGLVNEFLARDYHNPLADSERKGVRFDLLKCLDLYHSPELDRQVERMVINPERIYRLDNALPAER